MKVRQITIGTYSYKNKNYTFCLFQVPLFSDNKQIDVNFYRLIDLDVIFFENSPGYLLKSKKIPEEYFNSTSHHIKDNNGDDLFSSTAIAKAAEALDNKALSELCRYSYEQFDQGQADEIFQSVSKILNWNTSFSKSYIEMDVQSLTQNTNQTIKSLSSNEQQSPSQNKIMLNQQ